MDELLSLFNWNVRGLNDAAKWAAVCEVISRMKPSIVCIQESKLALCSDAMRCEIAGPAFDAHVALDAAGTRGGVLLFWKTDRFLVDNVTVRVFSITVRLNPVGGLTPWFLTTVYGPHDDARKLDFFNELVTIHNSIVGPWLVIGDFNLIKDAQDKKTPMCLGVGCGVLGKLLTPLISMKLT